jgi:hypothetical protein
MLINTINRGKHFSAADSTISNAKGVEGLGFLLDRDFQDRAADPKFKALVGRLIDAVSQRIGCLSPEGAI